VHRVLGNRRLEIIGRFTQALPNNWKLYFENVRDTYHASLLHLFLTTFRITRLSQGGGVLVSATGEHHASATLAPTQAKDTSYTSQALRADKEDFRLADPSILRMHDEFHDDIQLQILSIFPAFVLQQVQNALAVREIVPRGVDQTDLKWTYLGFADDTPELRMHRLKQNNLIGPAGFVSMEDGCVGGFVQRGTAAAGDELSVIEMGGAGAETQDTRTTEASVRGFWKAYRMHMAL
jgi:phenylpropionate dioxygenase-like ring-hydroxylating dioxygenase large terminal subunit